MDRPVSDNADNPPPVLGPDDPPPFETVNAAGQADLVLLCDHASNAVPQSLAELGMKPQDLADHIAWDSGAAQVTRILSQRLDAPAVLSGYSRLVIDCNRKPGHETSIPAASDGIVIPGNQDVSPAEAARRMDAIFHPYHHAVEAAIDHVQARGTPPAIVAIHSFTPEMDNMKRPWHISVLWDNDPRIPTPLLAVLRARGDLTVGENQPYSGREHYGYSAEVHATAAGLPNALIEIREDQIRDQDGIARYADILGNALEEVLADPGLYGVEIY
jgi:predicted N-formylglutamate amidohydrolase